MTDTASPDALAAPEAVFRPQKRRRVIRQREDDDEERTSTTAFRNASAEASVPMGTHSAVLNHETGSDMLDDEDLVSDSVADLMRRRRHTKARRGGVGFSRDGATSTNRAIAQDILETNKHALVPVQAEASAIDSARDRFAPQTGTVVESSNEHMTAFIDAELHRIRIQSEARAQTLIQSSDHKISFDSTSQTSYRPNEPQTRQPASTGQIQEVDLGPSAAARNATLTEAAYQRLHAAKTPQESGPPQAQADDSKPGTKPRLGRDGKPRPPRRTQRRPSADLARDLLVEAVMRESHLGLYPSSSAEATEIGTGTTHTHFDTGSLVDPSDAAADDELAARFQAEFLEAWAERRDVNKKPPAPAPAKPGEGDLMKGPKLGGSRSARAAMHAAEKEREKKVGKGVLGSIGGMAKR